MGVEQENLDLGFAHERVAGQKRIAVITGANSGLGFETARRLLLAGMRVVCACRSAVKGNAAVEQLLALTSERPEPRSDDVFFMELDVSSLVSVRDFAKAYEAKALPLHVLLCNAGIMMGPHRSSIDGIELQLATNYLGHFELCRLLNDRLVASAPARVVHVSSIAAHRGTIPLDELNHSAEAYDSRYVYSMTKLMQVIFSRTLNRRLEGTGVTSYSLEPGIVATNLSTGITDNPMLRRRIEQGITVEEGAMTQIMLCGSSTLSDDGGSHWSECQDTSHTLSRWPFFSSSEGQRFDVESALWNASNALVEKHGC